jgi:hypothetical protein
MFGIVLVSKQSKVKGCRHVAHTDSTHIKIVIEFTEDIKKVCLGSGRMFATENILLSRM